MICDKVGRPAVTTDKTQTKGSEMKAESIIKNGKIKHEFSGFDVKQEKERSIASKLWMTFAVAAIKSGRSIYADNIAGFTDELVAEFTKRFPEDAK